MDDKNIIDNNNLIDSNLIDNNDIIINDKNQSSTNPGMINCNNNNNNNNCTVTQITADPVVVGGGDGDGVVVVDDDSDTTHDHDYHNHHPNCHKQQMKNDDVPITTISNGLKNPIKMEDIQSITETTASITINDNNQTTISNKNNDNGSINITTKNQDQDGSVDGTIIEEPSPTTTATTTTTIVDSSTDGCDHYKRKAKFVTPCCGKFYKCRFCHDENENHHFDRKTLTELICTKCDRRQRVQAVCENCGVLFGKYTCLICNLFDDEEKNQYHCSECGICRVGGRDNFFHCDVCNMCLPLQLQIEGHKCVENISRSHCPVCLGDILTSRLPCHIPRCGHLLHEICFDQLLASGHYVCPTCQQSMIDMKKLWNYLDTQANNIPIPTTFESTDVQIFCNDCHRQSIARFHFVGLKCRFCGGYNTSQNISTTRKRSYTNNPSTSA